MHLDLHTDDQAAEVARLVAMGAAHVRDNHDPEDDYVVLADPAGWPMSCGTVSVQVWCNRSIRG